MNVLVHFIVLLLNIFSISAQFSTVSLRCTVLCFVLTDGGHPKHPRYPRHVGFSHIPPQSPSTCSPVVPLLNNICNHHYIYVEKTER